MPALTIVAHIHAEADHVEDVKTALQNLVAPTRAEKGCLQYDLHQDNEDPTHFMFYENWTSRETWQDHMNSDHLKANGPITAGKIARVDLFEMTLDKG